MQKTENEKQDSVLMTGKMSTVGSEIGTPETKTAKLSNRMPVVPAGSRFAVSAEQYNAVKTHHEESIRLLDSCGSALLDAMEMTLPPKDAGIRVGEYTGQNLRQMAKSVCDIIQTKTGVVRSMYQISRDEL